MAQPRRVAGPKAKNRAVLLDAAEHVMLEEGYAAVTSRRVAAVAGLKPQLVHYYFRSMDDLFLAIVARRAEEAAARQSEALASDTPVRALWELNTDRRGTALTMELAALANHRKEIRAELARHAEHHRAQQEDALRAAFARHDPERAAAIPPVVLSVLLTSVSQVLALERTLGVTRGHAETIALVEEHLAALEPTPVGAEGLSSQSR